MPVWELRLRDLEELQTLEEMHAEERRQLEHDKRIYYKNLVGASDDYDDRN